MINVIFTKTFTYFDLLVVSLALNWLFSDKWYYGAGIIVGGAFVSALMENKYEKESI